jgi:hypothetical protein
LTSTIEISYWPATNAVPFVHVVIVVVGRRAFIGAVVVVGVRAREDRMIQ